MAYGGRIAEELVFDRISTGASNDIKQATDLAERMVRSWGMSDLGPLSYAKGEEQIFLGREIAQQRDYSEDTARRIDGEVTKLISTAYERAKTVLNENTDVLHRLSDILLEQETVLGDELDKMILEMRPGFEFPSKHEHKSAVETDEAPTADAPETESEAAQPASPDNSAPPADPEDENPDENPRE